MKVKTSEISTEHIILDELNAARINTLDIMNGEPMKVTVVAANTNYPLTLAGAIAGVSTNKEPRKDFNTAQVKRALRCLEEGHTSVFEHIYVTFRIEGISRACSHQLVRHRHMNFCQESQRYVDHEQNGEYIFPDTIKDNKEAMQVYSDALTICDDAYNMLVNHLGIPYEDARYILPNAAPTKIYVTMNMTEFAHFYDTRTDVHAQWEIHELAEKMLDAIVAYSLSKGDRRSSTEWMAYCDIINGKFSASETFKSISEEMNRFSMES